MSPAFKVLTSRATRCSFSSIYHLRGAGHDKQQVKEIESIFLKMIILPLAGFGMAGGMVKVLA
jgi:hypothetical protein